MTKKILIFIVVLLIIGFVSLLVVNNFNKKDQDNSSTPSNQEQTKKEDNNMTYNLKITVNNEELILELTNNEATKELINKLKEQDVVVKASEYDNFEKVGDLGFSLPTSDEKIETEPGDLMLYQGNQITLFYNSNTWSYTRLGKVINKNSEELKHILGQDDVTMTLSLSEK